MAKVKLSVLLLLAGFALGSCAGEPDADTMKMKKMGLEKTSAEYSVFETRGP